MSHRSDARRRRGTTADEPRSSPPELPQETARQAAARRPPRQAPSCSFVPNGQFLSLAGGRLGTPSSSAAAAAVASASVASSSSSAAAAAAAAASERLGITQVVLSNQQGRDGSTLNYFLKLHSNRAAVDRRPDVSSRQPDCHSADQRLLNLQGILADIKRTIEDPQMKRNSTSPLGSRSDQDASFSRPLERSGLVDSSRRTPEEQAPARFPAHPSSSNNDDNNNSSSSNINRDNNNKVNSNNNESKEVKDRDRPEESNLSERRDSYRKLSPEKIKEISAWAEQSGLGFRGGNGKTDEIRVKDFLFRRPKRAGRREFSAFERRPRLEETVSGLGFSDALEVSVSSAWSRCSAPLAGREGEEEEEGVGGKNEFATSSDRRFGVRPLLSSTETSIENSRDARMEAMEASLDDIFNEFLERTLMSKLPYMDMPPRGGGGSADDDNDLEPPNESSASLPTLPTLTATQPFPPTAVHTTVTSSLSASNIDHSSLARPPSLNFDRHVSSLFRAHLKTTSDQNLFFSSSSSSSCSKPGDGCGDVDVDNGDNCYNSYRRQLSSLRQQHCNQQQQQQQQQQRQQRERRSASFHVMAFRDELSLLRARLMERIRCLESEHARKTMRLESKCSRLERIVVETFGLKMKKTTTTSATSATARDDFSTARATESPIVASSGFVRERLANIKRVVMTCDSGNGVRPSVKSREVKGQPVARKETMIDGSGSESGEHHLYHPPDHPLPNYPPHPTDPRLPANRGDLDPEEVEEQEVYVIVLKDGITIEGIHATVPQGVNAPIQVHQQDLKESFEAAFRALNDVIEPPSWTPSVSASDQRNQNAEEEARRNSQGSSSVHFSSDDQLPDHQYQHHHQHQLQQEHQPQQQHQHQQQQQHQLQGHHPPQPPQFFKQHPENPDRLTYYHHHRLHQQHHLNQQQQQQPPPQLQQLGNVQHQPLHQTFQERMNFRSCDYSQHSHDTFYRQQQQQRPQPQQQHPQQHHQHQQQQHQPQHVGQFSSRTTSIHSTNRDQYPQPPESWMDDRK